MLIFFHYFHFQQAPSQSKGSYKQTVHLSKRLLYLLPFSEQQTDHLVVPLDTYHEYHPTANAC